MVLKALPAAGLATTVYEWSNYHEAYLGSCMEAAGSMAVSPGSGLAVAIAAGAGWVRSIYFFDTAATSLVLGAAPTTAGQSRIDTIVARLNHSLSPVVQLAVKAGTAAASPSAPALTQSTTGIWEMPLADVRVGTNVTTIAAGNITDRRVPWIENQRAKLGIFVGPTRPSGQSRGRLFFKTP